MVYQGIIPNITIEDDKYIYYDTGRVFNKKIDRFLKFSGYNNCLRNVYINDKSINVNTVIYSKFIGNIPKGMRVRHINNNQDDYSVNNLVLDSQQHIKQCAKNPKNNNSGYRGVSFCKLSEKWKAQIVYNGDVEYLGCFETKQEASDAYDRRADELNRFYNCCYILNRDRNS